MNNLLVSELRSLIYLLPKAVMVTLVFIVGKWLSSNFKKLVERLAKKVNLKSLFKAFNIKVELDNGLSKGLVETIGALIYYFGLYLTLLLIFQIIGFSQLASFMGMAVIVLPKIVSALTILIIGVILAGLLESGVKRAFYELNSATARLSGKIVSYAVMSFFVLISLAEIGLASFFINTLFIGLVFSLSLTFSLALGLGSKDVVAQILKEWYVSRNKLKKKLF